MIARPSRPVVALEPPPRRLSIAPAPGSFARLLGAPKIENANGPLVGRAVQRHRLALVALLAAARGGSRPRDQIIDMLWPDADMARGPRLLSDSLYRINRALGIEALTIRCDSVEVDRSALGSDIADLDTAFSARDWPRVLDLHAATFLEGFYLPGAAGFDHWMETERARLQRCVAKAAESLSADARGIAVMPFRYIGSGDGLEQLVDVLSEEIGAALGRRTTIPVAAQLWFSAMPDTALDARELGRRLDVAWIVDGSLRQSGDALRVVARLTDTNSGYQIWSETFDCLANAYAAEIGIADGIATGIGERLRRPREPFGISSVR